MKLFGTDGIRGRANEFPMTAEAVLKIAKILALRFKKNGNNVVIGKDTRRSCYIFESSLVAGFSSMGMNTTLVGPISTPAVAMFTRSLRAGLGIMISASHNHHHDNGLKFFNAQGLKLSPKDEKYIEDEIEVDSINCGRKFGKASRLEDASGRYIESLKKTFPENLTLRGVTIVLDCANGGAYNVGERLFAELGASVHTINNKPNGYNINLKCGALHPYSLQKAVIEHKADIGIALDGDGDRVVIVDSNGKKINGDQIIATIARLLHKQERLKNSTVVLSVASSIALFEYFKDEKIRTITTDVGDKNILYAMLQNNSNLGGEPSGHIIINDYLSTSDALIAALQILSLMVMECQPVAALCNNFIEIPKINKNIPITLKCYDTRIALAKNYINESLSRDEKVIIRRSGTENVIRIIAESTNKAKMQNIVNDITSIIHG